MSEVFGIEDVTTGEILYESGSGILRETLGLMGERGIPFFALHEFDPEGEHLHLVPGWALAEQFARVIRRLEDHPDDFRLAGLDKDLAIGFFEELVEYCEQHPGNRFTCYVYP